MEEYSEPFLESDSLSFTRLLFWVLPYLVVI